MILNAGKAVLFLALFSIPFGYSQPPNDVCDQAETIQVNSIVQGTTSGAEADTSGGCGVTKDAPEVFYLVIGTGKRMTATTCSDATDFETSINLYSSQCSTCQDASNSDPNCGSLNGASVTWDSTADQVYTLVVFGRNTGLVGNFELTVFDYENPPNDYCEQGQFLQINGAETVGTTVNATTRASSGCGVTKQAPEVFYFVTGNGRRLTATTCSDSTDFDTSLTSWQYQCSTCLDGSTTDPSCSNARGARLTWDSTEGQVYTLVVHGRQSGAEGNFAISVSDYVNPSNDYCDQGQFLRINDAETVGTTVNATTRASSGCGVTKQAPEVFYLVTGNGRRLTATTCSDSTDFDTSLTSWQYQCSTCLDGSTTDTSCSNTRGARLTWDSTEGQVYTLVVHGRQSGAEGNFGISVTDFVNPPNDYCEQASFLQINGPTIRGNTINATTRASSGCGVTKQAPEVFYLVTGNGGTLTATTCSDATDFETSVVVWQYQCSTCLSSSVTDPSCGNSLAASVEWESVQDQVYTVVVFGRLAAAEGNFGLQVLDRNQSLAPVPAPTATPPTAVEEPVPPPVATPAPTGRPTAQVTVAPVPIPVTTPTPTGLPTSQPVSTPPGSLAPTTSQPISEAASMAPSFTPTSTALSTEPSPGERSSSTLTMAPTTAPSSGASGANVVGRWFAYHIAFLASFIVLLVLSE